VGSHITSVLLEFSEDPLSDGTPTYVDVTGDLIEAEWWTGVSADADSPEPGGAVFRLKSSDRRWEPDYVAGQFYPNIDTNRRFRLTVTDSFGVDHQQGIYYLQDVQVDYPAGTAFAVYTVTCADGFAVLALDDLPMLDPADADSYEDVAGFDEPFSHHPLGELPGTTKAVTQIRRVGPKRGKKKRRRRRRERVLVGFEAAASGGPEGIYRNPANLVLGEPGMVLGSTGTSMRSLANDDTGAWVQVNMEADEWLSTGKQLTVIGLVKRDGASGGGCIASGPNSASSTPIFRLMASQTETGLHAQLSSGSFVTFTTGSAISANDIHQVAATFNTGQVIVYVDGAPIVTGTFGEDKLRTPAAGGFMRIGREPSNPTGWFGWLQHVIVCEQALSPERILAHWTAVSDRGYDTQLAGERIAAVADSPLWDEATIQNGTMMVTPLMQTGQPKLEVIEELAHAEGPRTLFFFNGDGDPVYLGRDYEGTAAVYNTPQATLGDTSGEHRYESVQLVWDNEVFNDTTVSHETGEAANVVDQDSIDARGRRANTDWTDVPLMHHNEVESLAYELDAYYKTPALRPATVTLNSADKGRTSMLLQREVGHLVRVKRRGEGGTPIDRICHIVGVRNQLNRDRLLTCTWNLSRGFNAADGFWHAGVAGFSEAGVTTVAA
jgi:hypothetical protein